jgi:hypothetical protein
MAKQLKAAILARRAAKAPRKKRTPGKDNFGNPDGNTARIIKRAARA